VGDLAFFFVKDVILLHLSVCPLPYSEVVDSIGAYHICKKIEKELKCKHKKVIADRLADPVDESPNLFGKLSRARRTDWLNN